VSAILSGLLIHSRADAVPAERVIHITAKKFDFSPDSITLKKGEPVVLEISSADREHGFNLRAFGVRTNVSPGKVSRIRFTPDKTGKFTFSCDVFCGDGHEEMTGTVTVTE
jgi:cytochrome c oxidase subunit 2